VVPSLTLHPWSTTTKQKERISSQQVISGRPYWLKSRQDWLLGMTVIANLKVGDVDGLGQSLQHYTDGRHDWFLPYTILRVHLRGL
jgi:hypothetical protein